LNSPFDELKYKELLEGLEISEVRLSELEYSWRLDSEYYRKYFLQIERSIFSKKHFSLSEIADFLIGPFGSAFDTSNYIENGKYRYVRGQDVKPFVLKDDDCRYVPESDFNRLSKYALKEKDVLVSVVGTLGNACIVQEKNLPAIFSCKSTVIRTTKISPVVLLSYLNCKYGRELLLRKERGAIQKGLNLDDLKTMIIPCFTEEITSIIETAFYEAQSKLAESKLFYSEAEDILLSELGLKGWQSNNNPINIKQLKESFWASGRLDAEYYQTKYDEIESVITKYKYGFDIVENLFSQNTEVCDYKEEAYNYIEIGDINIGDGSANYNLVSTENLPDNAKRVLHKNDVLVSKVRPYRGAVSIIDFDDEKLIGSGAFTVLHEKTSYKKEVLQILLRTQIYKDWLLKWNVGSSYPVIKDEDIMNLPIPLFPDTVQTKIAEYIQKSMSLRGEAKKLLDQAKRMVEKEIEEGGE